MSTHRRSVLAAGVLAASGLARPVLADAPAGWAANDISLKREDGSPMPTRLFFPQGSGQGPFPLIGFSHGANSNGGMYDVLLGPLAAAGYVVVAPTHLDSELLPKTTLSRPALTASRVYETIVACTPVDLFEQSAGVAVDRGRIAVAGHSYGGLIACLIGGGVMEGVPMGKVPPIRAVLAVSPPALIPDYVTPTSFEGVDKPILVATGDRDTFPTMAPKWSDHLAAYKYAKSRHDYAYIGRGVNHYYGGLICRFTTPGPPQVEGMRGLVTASLAFLGAYVRDDRDARRRLQTYADGSVALPGGQLFERRS